VLGGVGVLPVPVSGILSGLVDALVVTVTFAVSLWTTFGEKLTFHEQEAEAASVAPQVFVSIRN